MGPSGRLAHFRAKRPIFDNFFHKNPYFLPFQDFFILQNNIEAYINASN